MAYVAFPIKTLLQSCGSGQMNQWSWLCGETSWCLSLTPEAVSPFGFTVQPILTAPSVVNRPARETSYESSSDMQNLSPTPDHWLRTCIFKKDLYIYLRKKEKVGQGLKGEGERNSKQTSCWVWSLAWGLISRPEITIWTKTKNVEQSTAYAIQVPLHISFQVSVSILFGVKTQ